MDAGWTSGANHDYITYLRGTDVEGVGKDTPVQPSGGVPIKHEHRRPPINTQPEITHKGYKDTKEALPCHTYT